MPKQNQLNSSDALRGIIFSGKASDLDLGRVTAERIDALRRAIPHMSHGVARYAATIVRMYDAQGPAAISVRDMFFAACVEADGAAS